LHHEKTVELYLPLADYDLETIAQLFFSLLITAVVAGAVLIACFPENPTVASAQKVLLSELNKVVAGSSANNTARTTSGKSESVGLQPQYT
jgi:hypothetical protein